MGTIPKSKKEKRQETPKRKGDPPPVSPRDALLALSALEEMYSLIPIEIPSATTEEKPTTDTTFSGSPPEKAEEAIAKEVITPSTPPNTEALKTDMLLLFRTNFIFF